MNRTGLLLLCLFLFFFGGPLWIATLAVGTSDWRRIPLTDQNEQPIRFADFAGSFTLVNFIYTRCPMPEMCPLTVTLSLGVLKKFPHLRVLSLTLDPEFDTPARLKKFAQSYRAEKIKNFTLATGNPSSIAAFASEFNVVAFPRDRELSHNVKSILFSPAQQPLKTFRDNEWTADDVERAIKSSRN
jgi:protein SCO1/2